MRWRRLSAIGTFTVAAVSRRDIAPKSNAPWCADPIAAFSRSALMPSSEWPKSALRMSDSFMISAPISARNFCAFCSCNPFQACWNSRNGIALSQSTTSPSCLSAARKAFRLLTSRSSFFAPMRAAARSQSLNSVPVAPSAISLRISRSSRPACLRSAFAIVLAGDILRRASNSRGKRLHRLLVASAISTSGKS